MAAAAGLSVTLVPVLTGNFSRGKVMPEHRNPINRVIIATCRPDITGDEETASATPVRSSSGALEEVGTEAVYSKAG